MSNRKWMSEPVAHLICTKVLAGYSKDMFEKNKKPSRFEFHKPHDRSGYQEVQKNFKEIGVDIDIGISVSKDEQSAIEAQGNKRRMGSKKPSKDEESTHDRIFGSQTGTEPEVLVQRALDRFIDWERETEHHDQVTGLRGAYIGGYSDLSKIILVGASKLEQYKPQHRSIDSKDPKLEDSYVEALEATNKVDKILKKRVGSKLTPPNKVNVHFKPGDEQGKVEVRLKKGHVFKSYHGMIRAMVKYQTTSDTNAYFFEIAIGETKKISSCFPCATYMETCGKPASSIHLGRGDNWGLPSNAHERATWEKNIQRWYKIGSKSLASNSVKFEVETDSHLRERMKECDPASLFLEALTFEGSFAKRVMTTFDKKISI